jgi:hypothetical protein
MDLIEYGGNLNTIDDHFVPLDHKIGDIVFNTVYFIGQNKIIDVVIQRDPVFKVLQTNQDFMPHLIGIHIEVFHQ